MVVDAGRQVAQLRTVLLLVQRMAGMEITGPGQDEILDESARISSAYSVAIPVARRRFEALAGETAAWAAASVEALLVLQGKGEPPRAAAAALARELDRAIADMIRTLRPRASESEIPIAI